jgi:large subunit ribosomal protein L32
MAVPKKRTTKSRRDKRRQHIFLKKPNLSKCPKCGRFILPHTVCSFCGYYKGKEVIDVLAKMTKKEKKQREKEIKAKESTKKEAKKKRPLSWKELSKK